MKTFGKAMTVLKCDYDGRIPAAFLARLAFVCRVHRCRVALVEICRTRHGYHVLVTVTGRIAFARIVIMQAVLGSDWKRELFNSRRAMAWRDVPGFWRGRANVLYQRHYRGVSSHEQ
jgi:hypothetical protein